MTERTIGTVERAYQLAPECHSLEEVRSKLEAEGHSNVGAHLTGPSLRMSLKKLFATG